MHQRAHAKELFTRQQWYKLPLALRRRWWAETDYGKNPPSPELTQAIVDAVKKIHIPPLPVEPGPVRQSPDDPALEPFRALARDPNGPNILEPSKFKKFWQAKIENPDDWKKFWEAERSMPWLDGKALSDIVSGRRSEPVSQKVSQRGEASTD